jgi:hypothetical protein
MPGNWTGGKALCRNTLQSQGNSKQPSQIFIETDRE